MIYKPSEVPVGNYRVLLLGTSKFLKGTGYINQYYAERINTCVHLYQKGAVKSIIISGDRTGFGYDETRDMRLDLVKLGVDETRIILDPKGFRTFDSIKRLGSNLEEAHGEPVLIISQYFHLVRALYLARSHKFKAIGVLAKGDMTLQMAWREFFAKARVLLDIYVLNTQTSGVVDQPRRNIDLLDFRDVGLLLFVFGAVAIAGRMMRILLDY